MGEARRKLLAASQIAKIELDRPEVVISWADRRTLSQADIELPRSALVRRAVRFAVIQTINAAFPQGMGRRDGKLYAAWLEILDDEEEGLSYEVPCGQIEWLRTHMENEDLKVPAGIAQWREAVVDYLETIEPIPKEHLVEVSQKQTEEK